MSGGSFDYLCHKEVQELMYAGTGLSDMVDALIEAQCEDVAKETEDLLLTLRAFEVRIQARLDRLQPVWRAMEWWKSCDTDRETFMVAVKKYRGEEKKK